ncbi:hypothetical protein F5Y14DRAFT_405494 [Nemania sp. NC0429]|nr:hypothetical protein F5Y14DRAFT_405494 [Nemania sp. NC0429]
MATPRLARAPTCLSCLRRLSQPAFAASASASPSPLSWTQTRARTTKAELEDLQGTPVRLLRDVPQFGRKHAIIRVKAGRMRNIWFPKGAAEYMTRQRFLDLGLTEAAIGVRDRTFGTKLLVAEKKRQQRQAWAGSEDKTKRNEVLTLPPEEAYALLTALIPEVLVFRRAAVSMTPPPPPEPSVPRSPSLAANAATSIPTPEPPQPAVVTPIFGSVSRGDILALIREKLLADPQGSRVSLDVDSLELLGLDPEHDGENRIKRLGTFEILISAGVGADGKKIEPLSRVVQVVPEDSSSSLGRNN